VSRTTRLLAAGVAAAAAFSVPARAETVLRYTEPSVNRGERAAAMNWFADEVTRRTKGELKINFFWGGSLMDARSSLKGVGDRAAEMGSIVGSYTAREMQPYNVGDLPVGSSDVWVGLRAMYELVTTSPDMKKAFDAANVVYLSNFTTTEVQLICKNKVLAKVEDFKGVKIRSAGFYGQVMESLGASVLRFSGTDANRALDAGTITCNHNYLYGMRILRDYEVAKDVIKLDWGQHLAWAVIINKEVFEKLPEAHRTALREAGSAMIDKVAQEMISANEKSLAAMQAGIDGHKVNVHVFPPAEREKLLKAGERYMEDWRKKTDAGGYSSERILASYRALMEKYDAELKSKNYPWKR
jgi:TRAP-type transport system periplasmic protein